MKFLLLILLPALVSSALADTSKSRLSCQAIYRTIDQNNRSVEKIVAMGLTLATPDFVRFDADLEGKNFSITEDRATGDLFAQITTGPEYTKGTVVRGAPDSQGRFTATEVDFVTVHRMECGKTR